MVKMLRYFSSLKPASVTNNHAWNPNKGLIYADFSLEILQNGNNSFVRNISGDINQKS